MPPYQQLKFKVMKIVYNKSTRAFSNKSDIKEYKDHLSKLEDYANKLKKSLSGSSSKFDQKRLKLAEQKVLVAKVDLEIAEFKSKYDGELSKLIQKRDSLNFEAFNLENEVAELSRGV